MDVGLAIYMDEAVERLGAALNRIDVRLEEFFADRTYGADVEHIAIGLLVMATGSEKLHPVRPLRYKKVYRYKSILTGEKVEEHNVLELDVKPDYEKISRMNSELAERYLVETIIAGVDQIESARKRFPDFDVPQFRDDLRVCLQAGL